MLKAIMEEVVDATIREGAETVDPEVVDIKVLNSNIVNSDLVNALNKDLV